jgi:drug/metabolite transporter (DMT)-like permease
MITAFIIVFTFLLGWVVNLVDHNRVRAKLGTVLAAMGIAFAIGINVCS